MTKFQIIAHWFSDQNWFVLSFAIVGWLNMVVAGARVMGWTQLADFCGKLEDAIQAMVTAALTRKQMQDKAKGLSVIFLCALLGGCAGYRVSHLHGIVTGNALQTPIGLAAGNITYDSTTCIGLYGGQCPQIVEISDGNVQTNTTTR